MVYQGAYHPNENLTVFQGKAAQRDQAAGCDRVAERDAELPGQKRQGLLADLPQDAAWTTQCHSESRRPVLRTEIKRSSHSRVHGVRKAQGNAFLDKGRVPQIRRGHDGQAAILLRF